MGRVIDADKLKKDVLDLQNCYNGFSDTYDKACIIGVIDEQPTAQPELTEDEVREWCCKRCLVIVTCDLYAEMRRRWSMSAQPDIANINKFIDGLEEIFADIRESHVDDSVCGLCEFDGAYIGESGDWYNECPGFNRNDCFKLRDGIREKWIAEITNAAPSAQPERLTDDDFETIRIHLSAHKEELCNQGRWKEAEEYQRIIDRFMSFASAQPDLDEWCDTCKEYDQERHCCSRFNRVIKKALEGAQPERKKGKWIRHDEIKNVYGGICIECSECGEKYVVQYMEDEKFCRNCGADMRGEQDG